MRPKFVCLAVLDGWGIAAAAAGNAISQAKLTNFNRFLASYPHTQLAASGEAVGLPRGEAGNTETGHLNLGAGRIVYQDLARINMAISDGTFFSNKTLLGAISHAVKNNSNLHLMGLIGAGGVHSNMEHLFALLNLAQKQSFSRVYLHLFTDGRDSPPTAAATYITQLADYMAKDGKGTIATIMGRYFAMDRDQRWERTEKAYNALTKGQGLMVKSVNEAIEKSYAEGKTDEFIEPSIVTSVEGKPVGLIANNDAVIFFNFRIDRPRQLTRAFVFNDFTKASKSWGHDPYALAYTKGKATPEEVNNGEPFARGAKLTNLYFVMMTEYEKPLATEGAVVAFPPETVTNPLGRVIADQSLRQLRITESEKERFVTFYFNGQQEAAFAGEERVIIPSAKVATYDLKPEMSAREITESLLARLRANPEAYKFILVNFANADMVGHTGSIGPAVGACDVVDECLGKLANFILAYEGVLLVTADHGNAEEMIDATTGAIDTEHSANPVPFIAIARDYLGKPQLLRSGILADVGPTVLSLLGIEQPTSMTGRNLLSELSSV